MPNSHQPCEDPIRADILAHARKTIEAFRNGEEWPAERWAKAADTFARVLLITALPAAAGSQPPCEYPVEKTTTFQTVTPFSDAARLNWIEQRFVCITGSGASGSPPTRWIVDDMDVPDFAGTGATLRAAIDSAMKGHLDEEI